jgi:predicted anti-sigma-YlaC factor YlaD
MTRDDIMKFVIPLLAGNMTCKELTEAVTDYLEGSLSLWDRVRFQMHLGTCLGCRRYLRQMRVTIRTLGTLPAEPVPPAVREELIRRFRSWKNSQRTS